MSDGVTGTDPGMRACGRPGEAAWLARVRRIAEVRACRSLIGRHSAAEGRAQPVRVTLPAFPYRGERQVRAKAPLPFSCCCPVTEEGLEDAVLCRCSAVAPQKHDSEETGGDTLMSVRCLACLS